jgi:hypothetical protein
MKFNEIKEQLAEIDEEILLADGFEDALVGYADGWIGKSRGTVAMYDRSKCIEILMKRDGMTEEESVEYFEFNTAGAYMGEKTPVFVTFLKGNGPCRNSSTSFRRTSGPRSTTPSKTRRAGSKMGNTAPRKKEGRTRGGSRISTRS